MKFTKYFDRFKSKVNDLSYSFELIDEIIKTSNCLKPEKIYLRETNLAKSILVRSMNVALYEFFERYMEDTINYYVSEQFDLMENNSISNYMEEVLTPSNKFMVTSESEEIYRFMKSPKDIFKYKFLEYCRGRSKNKNYSIFIERLFSLNIDQPLKNDINLCFAIRHCFVHDGGKANSTFQKNHQEALFRNKFDLKSKKNGKYLPTDYRHFKILTQIYLEYCSLIECKITKTPTEAGV